MQMQLSPDVAEQPARILIVDDERHNRQLLEVMLKPEGFDLASAASGEEALAMVARQPPDLILLDVMMPGMDGYQMAAGIKSNRATKNIPIIMITALDDRPSRMLGLRSGAEAYLTKPVDRAELCVRVRNLLRLKEYGAYYDKYSRLLEDEVVSRTADLAEGAKQAAALTEQAALVEQNRKDQMRFKDEFLSHVSHELRSPLTAIKQFTTILVGGLAGPLNKEQLEYQHIILKNVRQLQSMIDDLLEVTRLETGKLTVELESVSVSDIVADSCNTLRETARAKGVTLSCNLPPDLPAAYADQTRLRQILIILLDNAIKFTPDGGSAKIDVRLLQQDPPLLLFEVSDTGCGIGQEMTEKIFERLRQESAPSQASRKGLGLGLYICKELVTRHGGEIWVKRGRNKGTTFSFTLPVFSLANSIAPLLKDDKWPAESVALLTVHGCPLDGWASRESQEEWSLEARRLLQRCLLPDLDILLPKMSSSSEGERFFVAAFADEKGASVLANRIREQFERFPHLKERGISYSVSCSMLDPLPPDANASIDEIVKSMATNLESSIKSQIQPEAAYHE